MYPNTDPLDTSKTQSQITVFVFFTLEKSIPKKHDVGKKNSNSPPHSRFHTVFFPNITTDSRDPPHEVGRVAKQ